MLALGAGVGEEVLFRGLLQQGLELRLQESITDVPLADTVAIAAASLVFGLAHALNWAYFSFATLGGLVFGRVAAHLSTHTVTHRDRVQACQLAVCSRITFSV